jgi:hypothetical protein
MSPSRSSWPARGAVLAGLLSAACGNSGGELTKPAGLQPPAILLDREKVIDALNYWQSAAGLSYVVIESESEPSILIRPGTDGLAPWGGGRGGITGVYPDDNRARSGIVVFEPEGGTFCRGGSIACRYLYRHEVGHALGFLGHSEAGLMKNGTDVLTDRERQMMLALYSLPHGARVESDGTWRVEASGAAGRIDDIQAAQDVIDWNIRAPAGTSFREPGAIVRWELPVRIYMRDSYPF